MEHGWNFTLHCRRPNNTTPITAEPNLAKPNGTKASAEPSPVNKAKSSQLWQSLFQSSLSKPSAVSSTWSQESPAIWNLNLTLVSIADPRSTSST